MYLVNDSAREDAVDGSGDGDNDDCDGGNGYDGEGNDIDGDNGGDDDVHGSSYGVDGDGGGIIMLMVNWHLKTGVGPPILRDIHWKPETELLL